MPGFVDLDGRTALVTGGSRGIGEGIVRGLHAQGAAVAFSYSSSARQAGAIVEDLGADRCLAVRADLADPAATEALWEAAVAWRSRVDVLVNNVSVREPVALDAPLEEFLGHWDRALRVNLTATAQLSRRAALHYREHGGGIVIGISGRIGFRGDLPETLHDGASKGGMNALLRGMARYLAADGVTTFIVSPGIVETDQAREHFDRVGREGPLAEIPMGRFGRVEEVADVVTFLASGRASYSSGSSIHVGGAAYVT
jgi:3-oxoacyl-[acyl-carrier protein] reductase